MKGHMTAWLHFPGSGKWVNRSGSILRANEQKPAFSGFFLEERITFLCLAARHKTEQAETCEQHCVGFRLWNGGDGEGIRVRLKVCGFFS